MPGARQFEDLICWQEARELSGAIAVWLRRTPHADSNFRDQLRRASVSVQSNIAEGFDRFTHREFHRFLTIAKGSLAEVRSLLIDALDQGILDPGIHADLAGRAERLAKRLTRLMTYLRTPKPKR